MTEKRKTEDTRATEITGGPEEPQIEVSLITDNYGGIRLNLQNPTLRMRKSLSTLLSSI